MVADDRLAVGQFLFEGREALHAEQLQGDSVESLPRVIGALLALAFLDGLEVDPQLLVELLGLAVAAAAEPHRLFGSHLGGLHALGEAVEPRLGVRHADERALAALRDSQPPGLDFSKGQRAADASPLAKFGDGKR